MKDEQSAQTPLEDLRKDALKHYEEASSAIHHWSSFVENAIKAYNPESTPSKGEDVQTLHELFVTMIADFVFEVARFNVNKQQPYSALLLDVRLWLGENKFYQNKLPQSPTKGEPCSPLSADKDKVLSEVYYKTFANEQDTILPLYSKPFFRNIIHEAMETYAASLLTKRDEEVRELKSKCEADHCSIDELLSEFNRRGINTENWDGDDFAEAAIVSGVKNHIELRVELLLSERDKYKALAEAADILISQNGWGNQKEWQDYKTLKQNY